MRGGADDACRPPCRRQPSPGPPTAYRRHLRRLPTARPARSRSAADGPVCLHVLRRSAARRGCGAPPAGLLSASGRMGAPDTGKIPARSQPPLVQLGFSSRGTRAEAAYSCRDPASAHPRRIGYDPPPAHRYLRGRSGWPYDLWHAAASLWLNAGVSATPVTERAGHSVEVLLRRLRQVRRRRRQDSQHTHRCRPRRLIMTPPSPRPQRDSSHAYPTASGIQPLAVAFGCLGRKQARDARSAPDLVFRAVAGVGFEPT